MRLFHSLRPRRAKEGGLDCKASGPAQGEARAEGARKRFRLRAGHGHASDHRVSGPCPECMLSRGKSYVALQRETNGGTGGKIRQRPWSLGHHLTHCCRSSFPDMGPIPGVVLLKNRRTNANVLNTWCPHCLSNLRTYQLPDKCRPRRCFWTLLRAMHTNTLRLIHPSKGPANSVPVEAYPNSREVSWNTLERKAATYKERSQGHHQKFLVSLPPRGKLTGLSRSLVRGRREKGKQRPSEPQILIPSLHLDIYCLAPCPYREHCQGSQGTANIKRRPISCANLAWSSGLTLSVIVVTQMILYFQPSRGPILP